MNYGQIAYEAYRDFAGRQSLVTGATLPEWDRLTQPIKSAWACAANAVLIKAAEGFVDPVQQAARKAFEEHINGGRS